MTDTQSLSDMPVEIRRMKTSDLIRSLAIHETLAITERLIGAGRSPGRAKSEAHIAHVVAELDARIPAREK